MVVAASIPFLASLSPSLAGLPLHKNPNSKHKAPSLTANPNPKQNPNKKGKNVGLAQGGAALNQTTQPHRTILSAVTVGGVSRRIKLINHKLSRKRWVQLSLLILAKKPEIS